MFIVYRVSCIVDFDVMNVTRNKHNSIVPAGIDSLALFVNKPVQNNESTILTASRGRHHCCLLSNRLQNRHLAARHRPACDIHSNPLRRTEKERKVNRLSVVSFLLSVG